MRLRWVNLLCLGLQGAWLLLVIRGVWALHAHSSSRVMTFPKGWGSVLVIIAVPLVLTVIHAFSIARCKREGLKVWAPVLLGLAVYPAVAIATLPGWICRWSAEYAVAGPRGEVYYLLHAPPPLNGKGHSALARRSGGSPLHFTIEVLTDFQGQCPHGRGALIAALEDPNPLARQAARELLESKAPLVALVEEPARQ